MNNLNNAHFEYVDLHDQEALYSSRWEIESIRTVLEEEEQSLWLLATNELQMREE